MAALDLLGRRWTLRVLWELRDGSAASFRELRERCDNMSTSVLNQRLTELRDAGLITTSADGYHLTKQGMDLQEALMPLDAWSKRWRAAPQGEGSAKKSAAGR
jgi:DNA-binding HxlR family transcriptional regulator